MINCTSLYIIQDNIVEDNEKILISLKSYFNYVGILPSTGSAFFAIIEDSDSMYKLEEWLVFEIHFFFTSVATVGFTSSTFTVTEGVQSSCQVCIQLLAGTIRKTVSAYVATSALGIGQGTFLNNSIKWTSLKSICIAYTIVHKFVYGLSMCCDEILHSYVSPVRYSNTYNGHSFLSACFFLCNTHLKL